MVAVGDRLYVASRNDSHRGRTRPAHDPAGARPAARQASTRTRSRPTDARCGSPGSANDTVTRIATALACNDPRDRRGGAGRRARAGHRGRRDPVRARGREAAALETRARPAEAEGEGLRAQLAQRVRELDELAPYRGLVEAGEDWIWASRRARDAHVLQRRRAPRCSAIDALVGRSLAELTHPRRPAAWAGRGRAPPARRRQLAHGRLALRPHRRRLAGDRSRPRRRGARTGSRVERTQGVAVVRWPVVDGRREVVAYELIGDGDVLEGFPPADLLELGGGPARVGGARRRRAAGAGPRCAPCCRSRPTAEPERAQALAAAGFALALDGFEGDSAAARALRDRQGRRRRARRRRRCAR